MWQCGQAARFSATYKQYRPCRDRRGACTGGAPCDGTGCRGIPPAFWGGGGGAGGLPQQGGRRRRRERSGQRQHRVRQELLAESEHQPREVSEVALRAADGQADVLMESARAAGKRPVSGDRCDREPKRPSAEREQRGESSASGARRRWGDRDSEDSEDEEVLDSGVVPAPLAAAEEAMDAVLAAAEDSQPLAGIVGMDDDPAPDLR